MGFPAGYTDVLLPKLLINTLSLLGFLRTFILTFLGCFGLSDLLEPTPDYSARPDPIQTRPDSVSATLIKEMLPSETLQALPCPGQEQSCAVCLLEYEEGDEIRKMRNCRHVFHSGCVDRWIDHDRKTCPLCRKALVPAELEDDFNEKLWVASGIPDFYSDYSHITHFL